MAVDYQFSDDFERSLGDPECGGTTVEELLRLAEERIKEEADGIAKAGGFDSADSVLSFVRKSAGEEHKARIDEKLDKDFDLSFFRDLVDRAKADRTLDAQEQSTGFSDHNEFVEACEQATTAADSGEPDRALELKILNTSDAVIEGRDAGEGL